MDDVFSSGEVPRIALVIAAFEAVGLADSREVSFLRSCDKMLRQRGFVTPQMQDQGSRALRTLS